MRWILLLGFCISAFAEKMEMFFYWTAVEDSYFDNGLAGMLRKSLGERGWEIGPLKLEQLEKGAVESDVWVLWSFGAEAKKFDFSRHPKEKLALILWEPPTVEKRGYEKEVQEQFGKIFTWDDDLVDGVKFFKYYCPVLRERVGELLPFEEKKFCTMVATRLNSKHPLELYSEREKTIRFFEDKPGEFDLYGRNWEKRRFKNWKGTIGDKIELLKGYKFCICYENTRDVKGYITEKIFDCFAAGCVPVYWGASNVAESIPAEAFVDRRKFANEKELYRFLKKISPEAYQEYLDAAEAFLRSEQAEAFSGESFVKMFVSHFTETPLK